MLLKNNILLILALVTFIVSVDIAAGVLLIALLAPPVRKFINDWIIYSANNSDLDHRYARYKIHRKQFSTLGDVYSSEDTAISNPYQKIGHSDLKNFTQNYFSAGNIRLFTERQFIYSDQCHGTYLDWNNIQARGDVRLLLSSVSLLVINALECSNNTTRLLLMSNLSLLSIHLAAPVLTKYIAMLVLLQTAAKAFILYKHIGGTNSAKSAKLGIIEPKSFPNYFPTSRELYDRRPLILVEYENFPHWCVSYLLSTADDKASIDQDLSGSDGDYDMQEYNWREYLTHNCLAAKRNSINGETFICPYGNKYKFTIKKKYLNSALTYLNFSLIPAITHLPICPPINNYVDSKIPCFGTDLHKQYKKK